jgi:hypothetical protein
MVAAHNRYPSRDGQIPSTGRRNRLPHHGKHRIRFGGAVTLLAAVTVFAWPFPALEANNHIDARMEVRNSFSWR